MVQSSKFKVQSWMARSRLPLVSPQGLANGQDDQSDQSDQSDLVGLGWISLDEFGIVNMFKFLIFSIFHRNEGNSKLPPTANWTGPRLLVSKHPAASPIRLGPAGASVLRSRPGCRPRPASVPVRSSITRTTSASWQPSELSSEGRVPSPFSPFGTEFRTGAPGPFLAPLRHPCLRQANSAPGSKAARQAPRPGHPLRPPLVRIFMAR